MKSIIVIFYFLSTIVIFSQNRQLDSLENELQKALKNKADTQLIMSIILNKIDISNQFSYQKSLDFAVKGLDIALIKDDYDFIGTMYNHIGRSYKYIGDYDLAIQAYNKAVDAFIKADKYGSAAFVYNDIGNIYYALKIYDVANDLYFHAVEICNNYLNSYSMLKLPKAVSFNNIGLVNNKLNRFDSALYYFQKGLQLRKELNMKYLLPHSYNYLANVNVSLGNYKEAEDLFYKSIFETENLLKEIETGRNEIKPNDMRISEIKEFKLEAYLGLMELLFFKEETTKALEIKLKLEKESVKLNFLELIKYYTSLLRIAKKSNLPNDIIFASKKLFEVSDKIDSKFDKTIALRELIEAYKIKKDISNAFKYYQIFTRVRDTLFNSKFNETAYNFQKEEAKKSYAANIIKIEEKKEKEIKYQLLIRNISISFVFISIILSIFLYLRYKLKNKLAANLKAANEALVFNAVKVNTLNLELQESEEHLKLLNATKDKFFSIIAHDLKNPIGSIKLLSELMYNDYADSTDSERLEFLKILKNTSQNVLNLLINLLDWSRSQRGKMDFLPDNYHLKPIVNNDFELLQVSANNKNIELISNISDDIVIYADINMVSTVIRNLISNAIKFSEEGCRIIVDCIRKDSICEISITDNGIGMTDDILKKLFRYDSQITSQGTKGEDGTGLGLILCKELLDKNDGKIWAESEVGIGTKFTFTLKSSNKI
jgi:signal transduction histidine kinase